MISGASLFLSTKENFSIKKFYQKRFFAIFPMFYIAYLITFGITWLLSKGSLTSLSPSLLFTILGIDGLMAYLFPTLPNCYLIGEWFLGCILLMYFIYPFLYKIIQKKPLLVFIGIIVLEILFTTFYTLPLDIYKFPVTKLLDFVLGIYFMKGYLYYKSKEKKFSLKNTAITTIISILCCIILCYLPVSNLFAIWKEWILCILFFTTICLLGECISHLENNITKTTLPWLFEKIGTYSFAIFLVHHTVINLISTYGVTTLSTPLELIVVLVVELILMTVLGIGLYHLTNWVIPLLKKNQTQRPALPSEHKQS